MIWAYIAGLATLPAGWLLLVTFGWLTERNLSLECGICDKTFGTLPSAAERFGTKPTFTQLTRLKFKWHRWTGQCKAKDQK